MNRSKEDMILLDEKIARIRKQNEEIIRRKQEIDEDIARANEKNDSRHYSKKEKQTYSDGFSSRKTRGLSEDAAWRAERDQIDRDRILRQRSNDGWKREWDADKIISNEEKNVVPRSSFGGENNRKGDYLSNGRSDWRTKIKDNTWNPSRNLGTNSEPRTRHYDEEKHSITRRTEDNRNSISRQTDLGNNWNRHSNDGFRSHSRGIFSKPDGFSDHHDVKQRRNKNDGDSTTNWMKQQNEHFLTERTQPSRYIRNKNRSKPQRIIKSDIDDENETVNLSDNLNNIKIVCDNVEHGKRLVRLSQELSLLCSGLKPEPLNESIVEEIRQYVVHLSNGEIAQIRHSLSKGSCSKSAIFESTASVVQASKNTARRTSNKLRRRSPNFVKKSSIRDAGRMKKVVQMSTEKDQTVSTTDDNDDEWEDISGE